MMKKIVYLSIFIFSLFLVCTIDVHAAQLLKKNITLECIYGDGGIYTSTHNDSCEGENAEESTEDSITETNNTTENKTDSANSKIKIELLNGCGDSALFSKAKKALENEGYTITKTGTSNPTSKTTIINKNSLPSDITSNLKEILGVEKVSDSNSSTNKIDATIIIGKDYK